MYTICKVIDEECAGDMYRKIVQEKIMDKNKITAIVLAAGKGSRMHSEIPKQFINICDRPVLYYSLKAFQESDVDEIILVTGQEDISYCRKEIVEKYGICKVTRIVAGGTERYDSVRNGLLAAEDADYVLIHDGARPCITDRIISDSIENVKIYKACTVGVPVKDTIKKVDSDGYSIETPDRAYLWQIQTPQSFDRKLLASCYERLAKEKPAGITDDTMLVEMYTDVRSKVIMGGYENIKITTPEDLKTAEYFLKNS